MSIIPLVFIAFLGVFPREYHAYSPNCVVALRARNQFYSRSSCQSTKDDADADEDFSVEAFRKVKNTQQEQADFDGYSLRDIIYQKWGACFDVDFNRVESMGFKKLYLNILPFRLGKRPFRHASEYDYLCHLQAVVEILKDYDQLDYVLYQISETTKKPRPGTSPLVAVPLRLDLTPEQIKSILG
jgi:hypothetical protein